MSGDPALLHASSQAKGLFQKTHPGLVKPCRDVTRKVPLGEQRLVTIGESSWRRVLVVVHADRGDRIRIISARFATRGERKRYEEGSQQ